MKICLILFTFLINFVFAQDSSSAYHKELKQGIQFQLGNLLSLNSFDNYTISYKWLFNQSSGLRVGLLAQINDIDEDLTQERDSLINKPPNNSDDYLFEFSVEYLSDIIYFKDFSLFWGAGPFISYHKSKYHDEYLYSSYVYKSDSKSDGYGFGLVLDLGTSYNLAENIILSGEYGIRISTENSNIEQSTIYAYFDGSPEVVSKETGKRNIFSLGGSRVKLGICVLF